MKKIAFIITNIFIFSFFFVGGIFAEEAPSVKTLSAVAVNDDSAFLRTEFDSHGINYYPTDQPHVWFEYGLHEYDLVKKTPKSPKIKGHYISSQSLVQLQPNTKYWYRSAIEFKGNISYGETMSFISSEKAEKVDKPKQKNNNGFLSPDELYKQYEEGLAHNDSSVKNKEKVFKNDSLEKEETTDFLGFSRFWSWITGKKESPKKEEVDRSRLVHSEEEIKRIQAEREARLQKISEQENYNDSAANNDERGEIIEYSTQYKNDYKKTYNRDTTYTKRPQGNGLNYPVLFIVVIFLIISLLLFNIIMKKRKKTKALIRRNSIAGGINGQENHGKYYIPVKRDVHDPKQNPNTTFFRKPSNK